MITEDKLGPTSDDQLSLLEGSSVTGLDAHQVQQIRWSCIWHDTAGA
jgi:hypothetical protein